MKRFVAVDNRAFYCCICYVVSFQPSTPSLEHFTSAPCLPFIHLKYDIPQLCQNRLNNALETPPCSCLSRGHLANQPRAMYLFLTR